MAVALGVVLILAGCWIGTNSERAAAPIIAAVIMLAGALLVGSAAL